MTTLRIAFVALLLWCLPCPAAVVTVLNATSQEIVFTVEHRREKPAEVRVAAGEVKAVSVGRSPVLRVTLNGKSAAYTLDPYTPYLFVEPKAGQVTFSGVELAAALPNPADVPVTPAARKPLVIPVKLFADDANRRTKEAWEKQLRARMAAAADVFAGQAGITFEVAEVGEWASEAKSADLTIARGEFELQAPAKANTRAVGFRTRAVPGEEFASSGEPGSSHVLIREGKPRTEGERVEVLVQHLGRTFGAVPSPDRGSVMRPKLGDGQATRSDFRVQFDPINLLVIHIWAEELAAGRGPTAAELGPTARGRLQVLYKTLAGIHAEVKTGDTQAQEYADRLDLIRERPADADPPKVAPAPAGDRTTAEQQGVRTVVKAVTTMAKALKDARPEGDDLTAAYIQAAATAAGELDEKVRARAFLVGIGLALDNSTILRDKPVVKALAAAAETDAERKERLAVLGLPTVRGRRDLCQHFVVSAALTELFGASAAEFAGLSKELLDMKGTSGFSFADLAADYSGVEFAAAVAKEPKRVIAVAKKFGVADFVPEVKDLPEGLNEKRFKDEYGGAADSRFIKRVDAIRAAVKDLPGHQK
ncbi:MAG: hypothetical protein ABGY75_07560 [Gemmataceae bacterium]